MSNAVHALLSVSAATLPGRSTRRNVAPPPTQRAATRPTFDDAVACFQAGCWSAAYEALAALADDGHPTAARLALLMVKQGAPLFGGSYAASAVQRLQWAAYSD